MIKFLLSSVLALSFFSIQAIDKHQIFIHFPTDGFALSADAKDELRALLQKLPTDFEYELSIAGHTDDVGAAGYNQKLAQRRARAVKQFLLSAGMPQEFIAVESHGEFKPLLENADANARSQNRRVEISLTVYRFDSVEELEAAISKKTHSSRLIDPLQTNRVEGNQGTSLHIRPGSFIDAEGRVYEGPVLIELQEALDMGEFISHQLYTQRNDEVLISGGMFKVRATTESGEELYLDSGQSIMATVPTQGVQNGMQQFTSLTGQDWQVSDNPVNGFLDVEMPPYPTVNYHPCTLPPYLGYKKPKPVEPEVWTEPREPSAPDPLDFKPEIAWYQKPFAERIERSAQERLQVAQSEYQEKMALYLRKKDLYDEHQKNFKLACEKYSKALVQWQEGRAQDSIAHLNSEEYQMRLASNKAHYKQAVAEYRIRVNSWEELRAAKMDSAIKALDERGVVSEQMLNSYVTSVSELSWINIDRFWKMRDSERQMIVLNDPDKIDERAFIVFKNIKCILPMYAMANGADNSRYQMDNVPKDERFALMAYRVENGKPQVYFQDYDPRHEHRITYKEYTFSEFRKLLDELQV